MPLASSSVTPLQFPVPYDVDAGYHFAVRTWRAETPGGLHYYYYY
jgi:hypothetical protein